MGENSSLNAGIVPRAVKRMFDERSEERVNAQSQTAVLGFRGDAHVVRLVNLSDSGAMVLFAETPHIGETVTLQLLDHGEVKAVVRWVRDDRIGINFVA